MGLWRRRRQHRRFVALAAVLLLTGLPALARGAPPAPDVGGPGALTTVAVRGTTGEIRPARPTFKVSFHTHDLVRIWMPPGPVGDCADPPNSPPRRDGAPAANIIVKHDYPGVTPTATDEGAYHLLTTGA